jgi:hypothetical protein
MTITIERDSDGWRGFTDDPHPGRHHQVNLTLAVLGCNQGGWLREKSDASTELSFQQLNLLKLIEWLKIINS